MKSKLVALIKISGVLVLLIFIILYYFKTPSSVVDYWDLTLEATGYSVSGIIVYERLLWRYNPLVNFPKLKKYYIGKLKYNFQGISGEKDIELEINQTFLSISIKLKTDEISSKTITSELLDENGEYVIYYTYVTNPSSKYSEKNPMQLGTCKLLVDNINSINGIYWTNRRTIGDLYLKSKEK